MEEARTKFFDSVIIEQLLHLPEAQSEAEVQTDSVADHLQRKAVILLFEPMAIYSQLFIVSVRKSLAMFYIHLIRESYIRPLSPFDERKEGSVV
jgi:hypothetical protein